MATRAIRFSDNENKAIKDFLKKNAQFDFSTIARIAILDFIENPHINLTPIKMQKEKLVASERIQ